jgi:hypothetical protein
MLRGGSIPCQAAPRVGSQPLIGLDHSRPDRIEMDIVADRFQIAGSAALHDQGLVPAAKEMARQFVALIETEVLNSHAMPDTLLMDCEGNV